VFFIAVVGWLGASLQAAALHDLLLLCSSWLLVVYTIFTTIYWYILSMVSTQLKLFRGRKFNTIRGRDDSNNYNVAEMYLGVMMVSMSLFLLPTLAMFYFYAFISIILSVMAL
jgi:phosphatidylinositol N-acetylglucosaminyltransferase subunit Q